MRQLARSERHCFKLPEIRTGHDQNGPPAHSCFFNFFNRLVDNTAIRG
jgi:hypothetical protein